MFFYRIPRADEAMLISGGKGSKGAAPFRVVTGHGAYVFPVFRRASFLSLAMQEAEITETCYSKDAIEVELKAVMAFKVGSTDEDIINAGQRFIQNQSKMVDRAGKIFAGHLRSIAGSMSVEQMIKERQTLADEILQASEKEMVKLGLIVDSFQIEKVDDQGHNYIVALAAPHNAEVQKNARIAQANADRDAAEAERAAEAKKADFQRQTDMTKAGYQAQIAQANAEADAQAQTAQATAAAAIAEAQADRDRRQRVAQAKADEEAGTASAKADQAAPLAQAQAQHEVAVAATALAEQQAKQKVEELQRDVVAPAEADAKRRVAVAKAEAEATTLQAEALASSNRVQIDMEWVKQMPLVAQAIASEMNGATINVLNGAEGITELAAGVIAQAKTVYDAVKTVRTDTTPTVTGNGSHHELEGSGRFPR